MDDLDLVAFDQPQDYAALRKQRAQHAEVIVCVP